MKSGRKYVKDNIASGIDPLEVGEHEAWPEWLVEKALNDPAIRLPVALLYFHRAAHQRRGEDGPRNVVRGTLHMTQQKRAPLSIALHSRWREIIEEDAPKDSLVFLLGEKGGPVTESGLRQRIQKWALQARTRIVPHGLRRNAVNALLEAECSLPRFRPSPGRALQMIEHYAKERDQGALGSSAILKFEARNK
jgi:hypothetical protein